MTNLSIPATENTPGVTLNAEDQIFLIEGSSGTLEISIKNANASEKLKINIGDKLRIS